MFISPAFAQGAAAVTDQPGLLMSMLPLLLIIAIFYIMVIRPQNKRMTEHRSMLQTLAKGDKIVTAGGIVGTISKVVSDDEVLVDIADGVQVTIMRHTIMMKKA